MKNELEKLFEEYQQELGEDIGIGASMYGVLADEIITLFQNEKVSYKTPPPRNEFC